MLKNGNSYYEIYYHITFATKRRIPVLDKAKIQLIYDMYLRKAGQMNFMVHILNGYKDHIHILITVPPSMALANAIKNIKGSSLRAIPELTWQVGYYVKTLHYEMLDSVYQYIKNQWAHHENRVNADATFYSVGN